MGRIHEVESKNEMHTRLEASGTSGKGLCAAIMLALAASAHPSAAAQTAAPPSFATHCAGCHGEDAHGSKAPSLVSNPRVAGQSNEQLRAYLERGNTAAGMPSFTDLRAADLTSLVRYLRGLNPESIAGPVIPAEPSRKIALGPPQAGDWLTYNGNDSGNRYSPLKQITIANVSSLKLKWVFPVPYFGLETTPLAAGGVLYVTGQNEVYALDALTGNAIWQYARPTTPGLQGDAKLGTNRGVAFWKGKVYVGTPDGRLVAPDAWPLDVFYRPDLADTYAIFRIDHPDVLTLFGLGSGDGSPK